MGKHSMTCSTKSICARRTDARAIYQILQEIKQAATLPDVLGRWGPGAPQATTQAGNPRFFEKISVFRELRPANLGEVGKGCNHESKGAGTFCTQLWT